MRNFKIELTAFFDFALGLISAPRRIALAHSFSVSGEPIPAFTTVGSFRAESFPSHLEHSIVWGRELLAM